MKLEFRYQDKNTVIHRLNPVVILVWGGSIVLLSLLFDNPIYISILLLAITIAVKLSEIWREWGSVLKLCLWLSIGIIIINALVSYNGVHVLAAAPFKLPVIGRPIVTMEAIAYGAVMALKLIITISAFAFINLTVHPDNIMLVFLKMKFPQKSVFITSLSTRFIPCLVDDVQRIGDAYRTRGMQFNSGNWLSKLKKRAGVILPLLTNSLDRSIQVAEAMEARAFGTGYQRSFYKNITFSRLDVFILTICAIPLVLGIILRIMNYGGYQFYPILGEINPSFFEMILLIIWGLSLITIIPLSLIKRKVDLD